MTRPRHDDTGHNGRADDPVTALDPGRHDAIVVDSEWAGAGDDMALALSLTFTTGAHKGQVADVAFPVGSEGLRRALTVLGADPSAPAGADATAGTVLGMPCTLIVVVDGSGHTGWALDP